MPAGIFKDFLRRAKKAADAIADAEKVREERSEANAVLIDKMRRSIQLDRYSCGAQSTFMVLEHFGRARSIESVEKALGMTRDGTSQTSIIQLLRARGLRVSIIRKKSIRTIEKFFARECPIIAHMSGGDEDHWVVLYGCSRSHIWILDPSPRKTIGVRITRARFRQRWAGFGIAVSRKPAS